MSNLMHKMKDALTGHHESENKGSSYDSSNMNKKMDDTRDSYGAQDPTSTGDYGSKPLTSDNYGSGDYKTGLQGDTKMPSVMEGQNTPAKRQSIILTSSADTGNTGNTYGSANTGGGNYGSSSLGGTQDSMTNKMDDTGNTYGSSNLGTDTYDSANKAPFKDYSAGSTGYNQKPIGSEAYDSKNRGGNLGSGLNTDSYGSGNTDSYGSGNTDSYGSGTKDYGSNTMNTGTGDSQMTNPMDSGLDNRGTYGGTGQTGAYTSNYGDDLGTTGMGTGTGKYNTRSNTGSNMPSQMETRAESEMDKQGFGGAAAGGSSYNAPELGKRRSSGPHSSNLLNKLDPRVRSSEYESNAMGNQRGN
ncbi:hypothetical protein N7490_011081 [Penicillium lividum]|nr:hypothetical protein N7490_011081 [Penicillium lividum]